MHGVGMWHGVKQFSSQCQLTSKFAKYNSAYTYYMAYHVNVSLYLCANCARLSLCAILVID